jgi:DNA-binding MarR family transcriptional regulator
MAAALRSHIQTFVRGFGILREDETPCSQPIPLSHAQALTVIVSKETVRQKDLAADLGLDKSSVARLCQRMEQAGHVMQAPAADDARAREVVLTPRGAKLARQIEAASHARFEQVLAAIPRAERERVLAALGVLNAAVAKLNEQAPT